MLSTQALLILAVQEDGSNVDTLELIECLRPTVPVFTGRWLECQRLFNILPDLATEGHGSGRS